MSFAQYLQAKTQLASANTRKRYQRYVRTFTDYLQQQSQSVEALGYEDLLAFIAYCQSKGHSKSYLNSQLCAIRYYLDYLVAKGTLAAHVASGLYVRGTQSTLPQGLLSRQQLEALYEGYLPSSHLSSLRRKVVLGLMVYQGLLPDEMQQLQVQDLHLAKGLLQVRASKRSQPRVLPLAVVQIMDLQNYLQQSQLKGALFEVGLPGLLCKFWKVLQQSNPSVKSATQIKMSLLTHLLQHQDLRQVQAFAGHRYVSSTERYSTSQLQALQNQLARCHPLG